MSGKNCMVCKGALGKLGVVETGVLRFGLLSV